MKQPGRGQTPHHEIALYWAQTQERFVTDTGEPSCFACGWWCESAPTCPDVSVAVAWAKSRLERAHIMPHMRGGVSEPSNLLLLCTNCHAEAPDWSDREVMLEWVRQRPSWYTLRARGIAREWNAQTGGKPFIKPENMTWPQFQEALMAALDAQAGTHGTKLSNATIAAALRTISEDAARSNA